MIGKDDAIRDQELDALIERFHMVEKSTFSKEYLRKKMLRATALNNLAFAMADVAHSLLVDVESELKFFGVFFDKNDKHNFKQLQSCIVAARRQAEKCVVPLYQIENARHKNYAINGVDWWHYFVKLAEDRLGGDEKKANLLVEYLINMPTERDLFNIKWEDFQSDDTI